MLDPWAVALATERNKELGLAPHKTAKALACFAIQSTARGVAGAIARRSPEAGRRDGDEQALREPRTEHEAQVTNWRCSQTVNQFVKSSNPRRFIPAAGSFTVEVNRPKTGRACRNHI